MSYTNNCLENGNYSTTQSYEYDPNGNLIREYDSNGAGESEMLSKVQLLSSDDSDSAVYGTEGAWGFGIETSPVKTGINNFERTYTWDDKNRLVQTKDVFYTTNYVYNSNDERVAKYTDRSETLYFNNFWSWHTDPANIYSHGQLSKHIYLGDTRIVTKVSQEVDNTIGGEKQRVFYYHTDHLGSASLVTDYRGNEYERLEYTPYGELWVDLGGYTEGTYLPFKFSAKEMDEETGLYYFGARYLDPKYSMWISADPALGEYIPQAGRDKNEQLPGMGGVYTHINFHLYHYAGNNPVKYVDPDGRLASETTKEKFRNIVYGYYDSGNHTYITVPVGDDDAYARAFDVYTGPANQALIGNFLSAGFDGIAYVDETGSVVSLFNTEESIIQEYNRISPYKCVTNEMLIVGTMRFFADNGSTLSAICYASGNVILGGVIDGVSFVCDISLAVYDYCNSNQTTKDLTKAIVDVASTVTSSAIGNKLSKILIDGIGEQFGNIISNLMSDTIDDCIDIFVE